MCVSLYSRNVQSLMIAVFSSKLANTCSLIAIKIAEKVYKRELKVCVLYLYSSVALNLLSFLFFLE